MIVDTVLETGKHILMGLGFGTLLVGIIRLIVVIPVSTHIDYSLPIFFAVVSVFNWITSTIARKKIDK